MPGDGAPTIRQLRLRQEGVPVPLRHVQPVAYRPAGGPPGSHRSMAGIGAALIDVRRARPSRRALRAADVASPRSPNSPHDGRIDLSPRWRARCHATCAAIPSDWLTSRPHPVRCMSLGCSGRSSTTTVAPQPVSISSRIDAEATQHVFHDKSGFDVSLGRRTVGRDDVADERQGRHGEVSQRDGRHPATATTLRA